MKLAMVQQDAESVCADRARQVALVLVPVLCVAQHELAVTPKRSDHARAEQRSRAAAKDIDPALELAAGTAGDTAVPAASELLRVERVGRDGDAGCDQPSVPSTPRGTEAEESLHGPAWRVGAGGLTRAQSACSGRARRRAAARRGG